MPQKSGVWPALCRHRCGERGDSHSRKSRLRLEASEERGEWTAERGISRTFSSFALRERIAVSGDAPLSYTLKRCRQSVGGMTRRSCADGGRASMVQRLSRLAACGGHKTSCVVQHWPRVTVVTAICPLQIWPFIGDGSCDSWRPF